jgi:MFS family permease
MGFLSPEPEYGISVISRGLAAGRIPMIARKAVGSIPPDTHPGRWRMLVLLAVAELFGMSLWLAANAVAPQLRDQWNLSSTQIGWLTAIVQLGFVMGTATSAILNLADIVPARRLFAVSAIFGAGANAALLLAPDYVAALLCRLATGFALAGVYPPAMKMAATWFRARRGLAVGTVVGALTVGKAAPYLIHAIPGAGIGPVVLSASLVALVAAALVAVGYREGPYPFPPRPFSLGLVAAVVRERRWRLATAGYLGHMFELYSVWTWIPAFVAASVIAARSGDPGSAVAGPETISSVVTFAAIAVGGLGCVWGGIIADRRGREWLVTWAMAISGSCALLIGLTFGRTLWLLVPIALIWGFFVIADSAQFSVLVTETVPAHAVGTALTIQTSLGFLLTMVSIQLVPPLVDKVGWTFAFPMLALGPMFGIAAIRRLRGPGVPKAV